ncbi:MAG: hypothetical protein K2P57_01510 [Burkholderiales bacterium]|nr:hypothetical protein [Burkholderiales bacterium]
MGTMRDQMEASAQHVIASRQARMQATADVRAHVAALLSTYRKDRLAMASAMNTAFGQSRQARIKAYRAESTGAKRMIHSFHLTRARIAREQRTSLAADQHNRSQAVAALMDKFGELRSHNGRQQDKTLKAFVHVTHTEVSNLLKRARTSRKKMGREMTQELQKATGAIRHRTNEIETEARNLVAGFTQARRDMARQLENGLASGVQNRRSEVDLLLDGFRSVLGALQKDLQGASKSWQAVAHPVKMHPTARPVKAQPEPAVDRKRASEMSHEDQLAEIFNIISCHPEGISAGQIGEEIGLGAMQVGRLGTELAESGKVRKDEATRRYFP